MTDSHEKPDPCYRREPIGVVVDHSYPGGPDRLVDVLESFFHGYEEPM